MTPDPAQRFWDRLADRYAAKPVPDQAVYERKLEITRALLAPNARVLEVGCGTGSTTLRLAPHAGDILATDISARMIEIARQKAAAAGIANVAFEARALAALPDALGGFDLVLAHSLLHLLTDWREALGSLHARLAPGGALVMSTVCLGDGFGFMRLAAPLGRRLGLLPTLSFFTRAALEREIEAVGFRIEHAWLPAPRRAVFHVARKRS